MKIIFDTLFIYLDSLKWPITLGVFGYYFRIELKQIFKNGFFLKHGNTELNFPQVNQSPAEEKNNEEIEKTTESKTQEEIQNLLDDNKDKDNQIFKFKLEKHFEYTYRIIFKSQINLLLKMQAITDGFPPLQIGSYFQDIQKSFPILKNSSVDQYLKFVLDQNLIDRDSTTGKIKLTPIGNLFLQYIILNQYNFESEKII
ncbi:MAG: hypothetical protein Q8L09_01060 [Candidatus Moranbacteria bacterium]|nr:hypothetical protein [Candidatus Moranbacteria bacterium]